MGSLKAREGDASLERGHRVCSEGHCPVAVRVEGYLTMQESSSDVSRHKHTWSTLTRKNQISHSCEEWVNEDSRQKSL